jgi:hypothetical protein
MQEAKEGMLDLSEHEEEEVGALVSYLYTFDLTYNEEDRTTLQILEFYINVAIMADKYFLTGLASLANEHFSVCLNVMKTDWATCAMLAGKAYTVSHGTQGVRRALVHAIVDGWNSQILALQNEDLLEAMHTHGEFATDIALAMNRQICTPPSVKKRKA